MQAPLVGRRRELSVLKEMFHVAAEEPRPRLVILSGDAGVGKTRLSWELENYIDGLSATVLWHRGRCLAYGDGVAFSALTSAVRGRIGAAEDDTETATRDKLDRIARDVRARPGRTGVVAPALASLLGLAGGAKTDPRGPVQRLAHLVRAAVAFGGRIGRLDRRRRPLRR